MVDVRHADSEHPGLRADFALAVRPIQECAEVGAPEFVAPMLLAGSTRMEGRVFHCAIDRPRPSAHARTSLPRQILPIFNSMTGAGKSGRVTICWTRWRLIPNSSA